MEAQCEGKPAQGFAERSVWISHLPGDNGTPEIPANLGDEEIRKTPVANGEDVKIFRGLISKPFEHSSRPCDGVSSTNASSTNFLMWPSRRAPNFDLRQTQ